MIARFRIAGKGRWQEHLFIAQGMPQEVEADGKTITVPGAFMSHARIESILLHGDERIPGCEGWGVVTDLTVKPIGPPSFMRQFEEPDPEDIIWEESSITREEYMRRRRGE